MPPEQTPQTSEKPQWNFFETDPRRNFTPKFLTFCFVLIVVGLVVAGYYKYQAYQSYLEIKDELARSQAEFEEIKAKRMQTANSQTYRSEEYGFEIELPIGWQTTPSFEHDHQKIIFYDPASERLEGWPLINVYGTTTLSVRDWVRTQKYPWKDLGDVVVGENTFVKFSDTSLGNELIFYIIKSPANKIFVITFEEKDLLKLKFI